MEGNERKPIDSPLLRFVEWGRKHGERVHGTKREDSSTKRRRGNLQEIEEKGTSELFLINEVKEGRKIEREKERESKEGWKME